MTAFVDRNIVMPEAISDRSRLKENDAKTKGLGLHLSHTSNAKTSHEYGPMASRPPIMHGLACISLVKPISVEVSLCKFRISSRFAAFQSATTKESYCEQGDAASQQPNVDGNSWPS